MNELLTESDAQFKKVLNELKQYKQENKALKQQLNHLESQNNFNTQLLDDKSKHIISCTSENIALRKEIQLLQKKLKLYMCPNKSTNKKSKSKKSTTNSPKLNTQQLKLIMQDKQLSLDSKKISFLMLSADEAHSNCNEHSKLAMENTSTQSSSPNQMPYLIMSGMVPSMSGGSSNLSIQACKLSLPNTPVSLPNTSGSSHRTASMITQPADIPQLSDDVSDNKLTVPSVPSNKPNINININGRSLKTIAENKENSQYSTDQYTFSPITPITPIINESNNNHNIHLQEWNESIAIISQEAPKNAIMTEAVHAYDEESVISLSESKSDYYKQHEEDEEELSNVSGNTNLVYLDYSAAVTDHELPHMKPRIMETHSHITNLSEFGHDHDISLMKPITTLPITNVNINSDHGNNGYHFPRAISILSSLTISEFTDMMDNDINVYVSN